MTEVTAKAFLSYAHSDDAREGGRIRRLAEHIAAEFETLTGTEVKIFVDSSEIAWGQDFRARLDESLQDTTFFIPILTPTYFLRDECRKEMSQFVQSAQALGLEQLLLSIRYVPVPDLVEGSPDELKDIAARMQFEPWDGLRLADETSSEYRLGINRLAERLVTLTRELEATPVSISKLQKPVSHQSDQISETGAVNIVAAPKSLEEESDDAPGYIDMLVDLEPALNNWAETIGLFNAPIEDISKNFAEATAKMAAANEKPNAYAAKIVVAKDLAKKIESPVTILEQVSKDYSSQLLRLDPMMSALLMARANRDDESADDGREIDPIRELITASRESAESTRGAADAARANSNLSRDLRPLMRRYETALRNVSDAQTIVDGWGELLS